MLQARITFMKQRKNYINIHGYKSTGELLSVYVYIEIYRSIYPFEVSLESTVYHKYRVKGKCKDIYIERDIYTNIEI